MMPRFTKMPKGEGPPPTFLCRNREDVTRALAQIRTHMGISQLELDDLAGFNNGYTGKLEQPGSPGQPGQRGSGRSAIHPMFDLWLGALGVGIVIVPVGKPHDVTRAQSPAPRPPRMNFKMAQKLRALHTAGASVPKLARQFRIKRALAQAIIDMKAYRFDKKKIPPTEAPKVPKTHCSKGHLLTGRNLLKSRIGASLDFVDVCRQCSRERGKKNHQKRAALDKDGLTVMPVSLMSAIHGKS